MERIGVRELRQNASTYLDRVKQGESIEVTERGVPVAIIGPVPMVKKSRVQELIDERRMTPGRGGSAAWLAANPPTPINPEYGGPSIADLLDEQREERL
ncbi:type II toxin-antitoxin system Phd/YefM family antitoxin [Microcella frigidaquae]|jgi:prevent-host-death family protein|uniref:Antitoxin n=1 Tax=Microcella frigidaquae TaxID=424758 RepID=A0A840X4V1_9MICO|nr:type II toxin-antitoxin system prevent-host-death family antitoxin [Microcella frigidaquae]MBB5617533.1 prevent-host-death family protein [Microcella frigidaquae]NHN45785.1 type II toxin-antitoxin system prevent-host-death family antitoxin [Microcella frigidaquae]